MTLKQWLTANSFSDTAFAKLLTGLVKREIKPQSVHQWKNGTMPRWDVGEAITKATGGKVKPDSHA